MPERNPPPAVPVRTYPSPKLTDQVLIEWVNNELGDYTPLDAGSAHPNQREFSGFFLGAQRQNPTDHNFIQRIWVTPETSSDAFNYALKFSGEDNSFPSFIRTYREPRSTYTPRVKGTPLGTLYKTVMTNVGSGYANGAYPTVVFDDPNVAPTEVAIGHGVVSADGSITEVVLDFGGEGYTQDVQFRVSPPITGDQATGVAYVQPQIAILVREEASLYPPDSEFYAQYLQVTRVYETIPGPTFYGTQLDVDGATLTTATTRKLCADIVTGEDIDSGTWCKTTKKPTDIDVICEEVVVCRPIPGNTMESTKIDEDGKVITRQQTYVATSAIVSSETIVAGNWIKKYQEDVEGTNLVSWQIVEKRPVPGNPIPYTRLDDDGKVVTGTRTLKDESTITTAETLVLGVWTHTFKERVGDLVAWEVTESRDIPGNPMESTRLDEDGVKVDIVTTLKDTTLITTQETLGFGVWTKTTKKSVSDLVAQEIVETRTIPGTEIDAITYPYGENGRRVTATRLVERATYTRTANGTANSNFFAALLVDEKLEPVQDSELVARKIGVYDEIPTASNQQGLGFFVDYPYDGDPNFPRLTWRFQILRLSATTVADLSACPISGFTSLKLVDQKTEEADELIEVKVVRVYEVLPGKPLPSTKLDKYGCPIDEVRTKKDESTIVTLEQIAAGNIWTKTTKEAIGGGVAWEVVQAQDLDEVNNVLSSGIGGDQEVQNITSKLRKTSDITPSSSEAGGVITTVEAREVSDLVSEQRTTTWNWVDKAFFSQRIPDSVIPVEFRAGIPTVTESHILSGLASAAGATLSGSQLFVAEQQLTKNLYEHRTEDFGSIGFPIIQTNYETTEEYGGGILQVIRTLNNMIETVDQGEAFVRSEVREIGQGYLWFKESASRFSDGAWPILTEYDQDPETQSLITTTYQVIAAADVVAPSIVTGVITRFKRIDKWRSLQIIETYSLPADYEEQRFMAHNFPSLWDWTTYGYNTACGAFGPIREGFSTMVEARVAISFTTSKDTISGLTLIPNTHHLVHDIINAVLNDTGVLVYSGSCSGVIFLPASSPDYSTYIGSIQGTEQLITGESVRWRAGLYKNMRLYVSMI